MEACRMLTCAVCGTTVWICRRCDRGQRYCSSDCAMVARHETIRSAGRRHRHTAAGREGNARRQRAFYFRRHFHPENLTHHTSQAMAVVDTIPAALGVVVAAPQVLGGGPDSTRRKEVSSHEDFALG